MSEKLTQFLFQAIKEQFPILHSWDSPIHSEARPVTFGVDSINPPDCRYSSSDVEVTELRFFSETGEISSRTLGTEGKTLEEIAPEQTKYVLVLWIRGKDRRSAPLSWLLFPFDVSKLLAEATLTAKMLRERLTRPLPP